MSRIGKQLIAIPEGVTVTQQEQVVTVKGSKGSIEMIIPEVITIKEEDKNITVTVKNEKVKAERSLWGTWASHIKNAIEGVTNGYEKTLEVSGVGFKIALQGKTLVLNVGYSHTVEFSIPDDVTIAVDKNDIKISGINKQRVGQIAAEIRAIRKVEPYKGKGIKYNDEVVRRKAGKAAKTAA